MADLTRRSVLGVTGLAALGTGLSWDRLTGRDVPGRDGDALTVAILGTAADAASRQALLDAFREEHPDIPVRLQAVQGQDWSQFFTKILTMVAAGTPAGRLPHRHRGRAAVRRNGSPTRSTSSSSATRPTSRTTSTTCTLARRVVHVPGLALHAPRRLQRRERLLQRRRPGTGRSGPTRGRLDRRRLRHGRPGHARGCRRVAFRPFFWTNRLWGGVVPWLYVHGTSFLRESRAGGGEWFWQKFYAGDPTAASPLGGTIGSRPGRTTRPSWRRSSSCARSRPRGSGRPPPRAGATNSSRASPRASSG